MAFTRASAAALVACALVTLVCGVVGSDVAAASSASAATYPRGGCKEDSVLVGGRCVPLRDTLVPYVVNIYGLPPGQGQEQLVESVHVPSEGGASDRARASRAAVNMDQYKQTYKAPAGLPAGVVLSRFEFVANTSAAPRGATGVKCAVGSASVVQDLWTNEATGWDAFYSARSSSCYRCTPANRPRMVTASGTAEYTKVGCVSRCNPLEYTVVLNKGGRRSDLLVGNAFMTVSESSTSDVFTVMCANTFPGAYGKSFVSSTPPADSATSTACFPGDALVQLEDGTQKPMSQVGRGGMVLAVDRATGALTYSEVVLMAHAFEHEETEYIAVTTVSGRTLRLSPKHWIQRAAAVAPVGILEAASSAYQLMKAFPAQIEGRAVDTVAAELVAVGDTIFVAAQGGKALAAETVASIKRVVAKGIYAPLTLAGNLVVDGVLASAYTQDTYNNVNALGLKALHHLHRVVPADWAEAQAAAIAEVGGIMEVSWAQRLHMIGSGLAAAWWGNKA